jgi:hypothetical protein
MAASFVELRFCGRGRIREKSCSENLPRQSLSRTSSQLPRHFNHAKMRPLTEAETQALFAKLANYTGNSLKNLIAPLDNSSNGDRYVFRIQNSRCYYVRLSLANLAVSVSRDKLLSLGTCLGNSSMLALSKPALTPPRQVHQDGQIQASQ